MGNKAIAHFAETFSTHVPGAFSAAMDCVVQQSTELLQESALNQKIDLTQGFSIDVTFRQVPPALKDAIQADAGLDHDTLLVAKLSMAPLEGKAVSAFNKLPGYEEPPSSAHALASSLTLARLGLHPTMRVDNLRNLKKITPE